MFDHSHRDDEIEQDTLAQMTGWREPDLDEQRQERQDREDRLTDFLPVAAGLNIPRRIPAPVRLELVSAMTARPPVLTSLVGHADGHNFDQSEAA
jgi:hypothetical protein